MINIGENRNNDPHYRYKRSVIEASSEKNSTKLTNMTLIAKQLNTKVELIFRFIQKQLGLSINITLSSIRGDVNVKDLEEQLEKFIKIYVLCPKCCTPELSDDSEYCKACDYSKKDHAESKTVKFEKKSTVEVDVTPAPVVSVHDVAISKLLHYLYDVFPAYEAQFIEEEQGKPENKNKKVCLIFANNKPCTEGDACKRIHVEKLQLLNKCIEYCWNDERANNSVAKIKKINEVLVKIGVPAYVVK